MVYFAGCIPAGILVGALLPLAEWRIGGAMLGAVGGLIVYGAVMVMLEEWPFGPREWLAAILCALLVGPAVGVRWWNEAHRERLQAAAEERKHRRLMQRIRRSFEEERR